MTPDRFLSRIKNALVSATSVEVFVDDQGNLELVAWLDKKTAWGQHTEKK